MTVSTTTLTVQLRALSALTDTEIHIAQTRTAQARTDAVRRELRQNAENARQRSGAIAEALRGLGATPELVRPVFGRMAAMGKALAEQTQPLDEAILGDLALEHQLLDRARYVKGLATAADEPRVIDLADRLITAHTATVDWLTTVLAEEALGGPAALRRSPTQWGVGLTLRAATLPAAVTTRAAEQVAQAFRRAPSAAAALRDRVADAGGGLVDGTRRRVDATTTGITDKAEKVGTTIESGLVAGRDAALEAAEINARGSGASGLADSVAAIRDRTGALTAAELPIADYDDLNVSAAASAVKKLDKPEDIRTVVAYEEAHRDRAGIVSAAQARLVAIAKEIVGVE